MNKYTKLCMFFSGVALVFLLTGFLILVNDYSNAKYNLKNSFASNVSLRTNKSLGSGVVIGKNIILTVEHLINSPEDMIWLTENPEVKVKIKTIFKERYAMLLEANTNLETLDYKIVSIADKVNIDEIVYVCNRDYKKGRVLSSSYGKGIVVTIQTVDGDSGSGIYNLKGELLGICCSAIPNIYSETHTDYFTKFIDVTKLKSKIAKNKWKQ